RLRTSGDTDSGTTLPFGPLSVTSRLATSIASTVAVILRFCAIVAWPGDDVITALSSAWAAAGRPNATTSDAATMIRDGCFIRTPREQGKGGRGGPTLLRRGAPAGPRVERGHLLGDRAR